jgi:hypothetical protein
MFCSAIAFPAILSNRLGFYYLVCDFEGRISFASPRVQNLPQLRIAAVFSVGAPALWITFHD